MEKAGDIEEGTVIRLNPDWAEVALFNLGVDGFNEYQQRVYAALTKLCPNHYYDILSSVPPYRRETFLGLCHRYMDQHPDYELTEDNCRIYNRKK